jgi:hypothetical protein
MPNYNAQNPPFAVYPGDVVFPFNAESPAPPQASQQFALGPTVGGSGPGGRVVVWQISFASAPGAVNAVLQAADVDADPNYQNLDTSTNTAGERRQVANVQARFLRVRLVSQTSGGAITVSLGV